MSKAAISVLNSLLIEEITAADLYKRVLQKLPDLDIKSELDELHIAHSKRAQKLKKRLRELGETPVASKLNGRTLDLAANGSAEERAMRVLLFFQNVETSILSSYETSLNQLDQLSLSLVQSDLIPEQELTDNVVYTLRTGIQPLAKSA